MTDAEFERCLPRWRSRARKIAAQMFNNRESREDAVQTAMVKLWEKRGLCSFPSDLWVDTVIKNTCLDIIRHRKRRIKPMSGDAFTDANGDPFDFLSEVPGPSVDIEDRITFQRVIDYVESLGLQDELLYLVRGESDEEARRLGVTRSALHARVTRARVRVRDAVNTSRVLAMVE